jgi:hypothetical protein
MGCGGGYGITAIVLAIAIPGCSAGIRPAQSAVHVDAETLAAELEDAYRTSSPEKLATFLQTWHDSLPPKDIKEITDPMERELYSIFQSVFKPFDLNTLITVGGWDYAEVSEMYRRVRYIIVQDSVRLQVDDKAECIVRDFRPALDLDEVDILYLTPTYREALIAFLETDDTPGLIDVDKSLRRIQFLGQFVCVRPGHWSGWDLETPPTIDLVTFNETASKATISFSIRSIISHHGSADMERTPDGWLVSQSGIVAIE